jgi:outer membrane receptor protein involved in Fe transport
VQTLDGSLADRFAVANVTLSTRPFRNGLSFSANVYNLFDSEYGYPGGDEHLQNIIYQDGRTLRIGLKYGWRTRP